MKTLEQEIEAKMREAHPGRDDLDMSFAMRAVHLALRTLAESADEFPQLECERSCEYAYEARRIYFKGAKWMFEQDRARIGYAEMQNNILFERNNKLNELHTELIAHAEKAERELKDSRAAEQCQRTLACNLQIKLAAAEAEISEVRRKWNDDLADAHAREDKLEARVRELEAENRRLHALTDEGAMRVEWERK